MRRVVLATFALLATALAARDAASQTRHHEEVVVTASVAPAGGVAVERQGVQKPTRLR
jgi:hypothetical protein